MEKWKKILILFKTTFLISLTTNTGYAILSVMRSNFVNKYRWFSEEEMTDYIALAQSSPGPMAINASLIIGWQIAGFAGALSAVLGCALPPLLVMLAATFFYNKIISNSYVSFFMKGMQFGIAAMLLDVLLGLLGNVLKKEKIYPVCLIILSFFYIKFINGSVFILALGCILVSLIRTWYINKEKRIC